MKEAAQIVAQGMYGSISDIPYLKASTGSIDRVLEHHIASIEELRGKFKNPQDTQLLNIIDEMSALFSQTLYKLRNLK